MALTIPIPESSAFWVFIQLMHGEGIINEQFSHIQHLKMVGRADHFVQLINVYCFDVGSILAQLASYIEHPDVDFSKLAALAAEVAERSSRIGAEHVRLACGNLMQACDQMQKQKFLQALILTKTEFARTRNSLQAIVQVLPFWLCFLHYFVEPPLPDLYGAEDYETRSKTTTLGMLLAA